VSAVVVLWALRRDGSSAWAVIRLALLVCALGVAVGFVEVLWLGWYAATLSVLLRIPQMRLVHTSLSIQGVSVHTWLLSLAANGVWLLFGMLESDERLVGACSVNGVLSLSLIAAVEVRRRREAKLAPAVVTQT
jgi:uncharacterized protein with PQ loop repeat